ncbi:MAG: ABC transporter permease [Anaerolineae bacterium]|nr:ABC transporter permease [Anaerolineae bacterium]MDW8099592.1 ABC transporter permease [Anaerolineae bacterium]
MDVQIEATKSLVSARAPFSGLVNLARRYGLQLGIVGVALFIWILFLIGSPKTFLSYPIYEAFMSTTPFFALMALPLTLVIIAAEIDLSFPSIMAFGMTVFSIVLVSTNSVTLAFVACLLAGWLAGLLNGVIVVKIGIPSLVATIGTQFFWRGVVLVVTGGNGTGLTQTKGTLLYEALVGRLGGRVPAQMIWTIIVAIVIWFLLNRHKFGAHVYLTGDNVESAKLMGVNVARVKMLTFAIVGLAAAFAGVVVSLEVLYFWPTLGEGYLLNTLASVFLGGTSVFGGAGTVFGTFVASFIIGAINAGIVAAGLTGFWTQLIYGLIIVISVSLQSVLSRRLA